MRLSDRLRRGTREQHQLVEGLPFFEALADARLPRSEYVGYLRAMAVVHETVELELEQSTDPRVTAVWSAEFARLGALRRDLKHFESTPEPEPPPRALLEALVVADEIRERAATAPPSVIGCLYVLQGSTLGGSVLRRHVERSYGVSRDAGAEYLSPGDSSIRKTWESFKRKVDETPWTPAEEAEILGAARLLFAGLEHVFRELHGRERDAALRESVRSINPAAGSHLIADDPREIRASFLAGHATWRRFPYLKLRYGERGRAFTRSDSAWLAHLTRSSEEVVLQQVEWLGGVLASRGMPQWILEVHLGNLHEELVRAIPEKRERYEALSVAAQRLREGRVAQIDEERFESLYSSFRERVGAEWNQRLPEAGALLVAAVADEKAGLAKAVSSIEGWMSDPTRFPDEWIAAVRETIRKARDAGP